MNPAIAESYNNSTSRNKIVDLSVASKYLLDSHPTSYEEAEDETQQTSTVGTLGLVEVEQVRNDLSRPADVPDVSEHAEC